MSKRYFSKKIVEWYQQNRRNLPWRETTDPYKIWLSEIILQQTRVAQGLPYYEKFISTFPTIQNLAEAKEQQVLRLWQGLGYYTRARNLHRCAKVVSAELGGEFPTQFEQLRQLPGIGEYTAAAIASFSFGEAKAVLDGNVFRVLARLYGIETPINSTEGKKIFSELASGLISRENPDVHNQAIMEFGAMCCTPKAPRCEACIFIKECVANKNSLQELLPLKIRSREKRKRFFHYLVYKKGNSLLMKKRSMKDIWHGLYDFPLVETTRANSVSRILPQLNPKLETDRKKIVVTKTYNHILTHQTIECKFFIIPVASHSVTVDDQTFYSMKKIGELPKPVIISRFLEDYSLL